MFATAVATPRPPSADLAVVLAVTLTIPSLRHQTRTIIGAVMAEAFARRPLRSRQACWIRARRAGPPRRSVVTAVATFGAFTLLAAGAAARLESPGPFWAVANLVTLSRACTASWLCGYATSPRPGALRTATWMMLLWATTATDWLDGPLARRIGPTPFGAILDLEADSWLTLSAAIAAWRSRGLPVWCLIPPTLRYVVRRQRGLSLPMATAGWQKTAGASQMVVLIGALAPNRTVRGIARRMSPWAVLAQLVALAADARPRVTEAAAATLA